jgi:uncharacterized protein
MDEKNQYIYQLKVVPRLLKEENWKEEDNKIVIEHFERLKVLTEERIVILAGRTLKIDEGGYGLVIFEATNDEEAQKIMENDPAVKKGIMTAQLHSYRVALLRK